MEQPKTDEPAEPAKAAGHPADITEKAKQKPPAQGVAALSRPKIDPNDTEALTAARAKFEEQIRAMPADKVDAACTAVRGATIIAEQDPAVTVASVMLAVISDPVFAALLK